MGDFRGLRTRLRRPLNELLSPLGVRLVARDWGPRGQLPALAKLRARGVELAVIVDAGASDGSWTRGVLGLFPRAKVLLVDPLPQNRPALERLCSERANCRFFEGALSSEVGLRSLVAHGDQSSFYESSLFKGPKIQVRQTPLDALLDTEYLPTPPDLLKADVQGAELAILAGATRCLKHARWLLLEVSFEELYDDAPLADEVITVAATHGFRIRDICAILYSPAGELQQADILFERTR